MTAPVFVTETRPAVGTTVLDGAEGRHAVSVRRLRPGEDVVLTDGAGTGGYGTVTAATGKDQLEVAVAEVRTEPPPVPHVTVVQALPKSDRGELAVETMTEIGVDAIVPWSAARCVTRWRGERRAKALAKWRSTAREAGKQARRLRFPQVREEATTRQVCGLLAQAALPAVLHEEGSEPLATAALPPSEPGADAEPGPGAGEIVLVVGPEGGITPDELAAFREVGARPYHLGSSVLRSSTAGTAAAALLLGRSGRWG